MVVQAAEEEEDAAEAAEEREEREALEQRWVGSLLFFPKQSGGG
jgi:hypothetical protein